MWNTTQSKFWNPVSKTILDLDKKVFGNDKNVLEIETAEREDISILKAAEMKKSWKRQPNIGQFDGDFLNHGFIFQNQHSNKITQP